MKKLMLGIFVWLLGALVCAQTQSAPKYAAKVPPSIQTPDTVQTRIGTLKLFDGLPDDETVKKVYDQLDFGRGVEAFMAGMPAASIYAVREGFEEGGLVPNHGIGIMEDLLDARSLFLTPNSTTVYVFMGIDLKDGPVVVEVPPGVLGPINDAYFRYVADVGMVGPDQGKGGKYLLVPPGYTGELPSEGYFIAKSPTYSNIVFYRAFVKDGDIAAAAKGVKERARLYPLSAASNPPAQEFVNLSGKQFNTIHANDFHFYEELNAVVQHEPADFVDPETVGLFAAIGIKKGNPFAPDARMKAILTDAVAVGNAAARAIVFDSRDPRARIYPDRQWFITFVGGSSEFYDAGERMLDARTLFHYYATGITPAMAASKPGTGSAYALAARDAQGNYLDGGKTYKITLPAPIPAKQFWSFTVYDNQTRSMLDEMGVRENTIFIYTSDNGPEFSEAWFGHAGPWGGTYFTQTEASLRVPFIIRWPGKVPAGAVNNEIVHQTDLYPTLARLAGGKVPADRVMDGIDQTSFLLGKQEKSDRESVVIYVGNDIFGVKWRNWKMLNKELDAANGPVREYGVPRFYNLLIDPKEEHPAIPSFPENFWVRFPAGKVLTEHIATIKKEPHIRPGQPDPYTPQK